jgi:hypothetical protein
MRNTFNKYVANKTSVVGPLLFATSIYLRRPLAGAAGKSITQRNPI